MSESVLQNLFYSPSNFITLQLVSLVQFGSVPFGSVAVPSNFVALQLVSLVQFESVLFPSSTGGAAQLTADTGLPVLARLPLDGRVARACDEGTHFLAEHSGTPAALAYLQLAASK